MKNVNTKIEVQMKDASAMFNAQDIFDLAFHFCDDEFDIDTVTTNLDMNSVIINADLTDHTNATKFKTAMKVIRDLKLIAQVEEDKEES